MRTRIKDTLSYWKNKAGALYRSAESARSRGVRQKARIAKLEARVAELEAVAEPRPIKGLHYPAQMVALAVFMVVSGGSLRLAAKVVGFYAKMMGWSCGSPSHTTVRNWMMRCGLHGLNAKREALGRMTLIIDESVQIGKEKLLLILGIPDSMHQTQCGELRHTDVEVLGMSVRTAWPGEDVAAFIRERMGELGLRVNGVISDCGTNLLKAYRMLGLRHISDCSHHMMNGVKAIFKDDAELAALCASVGGLRRRLCMTDYAYLLPPALRDKDRFCRMFQLADWIGRVDAYREAGDEGALKHLSFLEDAGALRLRLSQVAALVKIAGVVLRRSGLSLSSRELFGERARAYLENQAEVCQQAHDFIAHMELYFDKHEEMLKDGSRWLCCSEVIESVFGRYKNKGGMNVISADILSIPLYGKEITVEFVTEALQATSHKQLESWETKQVCMNRYGIIRSLRDKQKARTA